MISSVQRFDSNFCTNCQNSKVHLEKIGLLDNSALQEKKAIGSFTYKITQPPKQIFFFSNANLHFFEFLKNKA